MICRSLIVSLAHGVFVCMWIFEEGGEALFSVCYNWG